MYTQQHLRLYKTVKLVQLILNLIHFNIKHRFDWEYLAVCTNLSNYWPYSQQRIRLHFGLCTALIYSTLGLMRSSMAPRSVRIGMRSRKLSNVSQSLDG
jgi:hypothetical protein